MHCAAIAAFLAMIVYAAPLPAQEVPKPAEMTDADLVRMSKEIEKEVEEIRGWKFKHEVKTAVYTEDQLRKFIEKRLFEEEYGGGKLDRLQGMLRLLGMIPEDCDVRTTIMDVLLNQIGGFYDPPSRSFYMLKRSGVSYSKALFRVLVAHELTHALDDQYVELDKLLKGGEMTEDRSLAIGAVIEGSATQLMTVYSQRLMKSGQFDNAETQQYIKDEMAKSQVFIQAPRYFTTLMANYICGMYFVVNGDMQAVVGEESKKVADNILRALKDPPLSSEQVLHPEKYWNRADRDVPVMFDDAIIEKLLHNDGEFVVHKNTIGEVNCALLSQDAERDFNIMLASFPKYWTTDAAQGWGGDRFYMLASGADKAAAEKETRKFRGVWLTAWDTADDRVEFLDDYLAERELPARRHFKLAARVHVFTFGFTEAQTAAFEKALRAAPPMTKKDGKPWSPDSPE